MKEELELLISEAKNGVMTISDFYADEVAAYFIADTLFLTCLGLFVMATGLLYRPLMSTDWWYKYNSRDGNAYYGVYVVKAFTDGKRSDFKWSDSSITIVTMLSITSFVGFIITAYNLHNFILICVAPKIYITKELVNFF